MGIDIGICIRSRRGLDSKPDRATVWFSCKKMNRKAEYHVLPRVHCVKIDVQGQIVGYQIQTIYFPQLSGQSSG